jgi:hypothetical protein
VEDRDEEEVPPLPKDRGSRFADDDYLPTRSKPKAAPDAKELEEEAENAPLQNPWQRIRNERLEREPSREELRGDEFHRDEPIPKKQTRAPSKKAQYRSPPGQDIELESDWLAETAARPRNQTQRSAPR